MNIYIYEQLFFFLIPLWEIACDTSLLHRNITAQQTQCDMGGSNVKNPFLYD